MTIRYAMSRRRRSAILVLAGLAVVSIIWLDRNAGRPLRHIMAVKGIAGTGNNDHFKYHRKSFKVVNVVDGDTVDIDIPDGKYDNTRVRLLGVDTPETKSERFPVMYYGPEATDFVKKLVSGKDVTVILDSISPSRDRYGRLLAWLEIESGVCVNAEIVRGGFGYTDLRFDNDRFDEFVELQDAAVRGKVGLWKEVTKEQLPKWLQRERPRILTP